MLSEMRAPNTIRLYRSRPLRSVPIQYFRPGNAPVGPKKPLL